MKTKRRALTELWLLIPAAVVLVYAGIYIREKQGQAALLNAMARDDTAVVEQLLNRGIDPRKNRPRGASAISLASSARAFHTLQYLLKRGEHPSSDDVVMPALRGDKQMTDMLLSAGADPNGNVRGLIPLLLELASQRNTEMMEHMLEAGANPNVASKLSWNKPLGCTPLMASVLAVNPEGVRVLIKAKCQLNNRIDDPASTWNGYSAMMMAVKMHDMRSLQLLIAAGARRDIRGADGKTAGDLAQELHAKEMILMLANKPNITAPHS
jgi:uncharacterized protein